LSLKGTSNCRSSTGEARELKEEGNKLLDAGRINEAMEKYKEAIRLKPDYAIAHSKLGVAYAMLERYDEAIAPFKKVIRIKPDSFGAYHNLGSTYAELKRYEESIFHYEKAISIKPNQYGYTHYNLGNSYVALLRYKESIPHYKKAITLKSDDYRFHANLGMSYRRLGLYDEAIVPLKEAIRLKPDDGDAYQELGYCYLNLNSYEESIFHYEKAIRFTPDHKGEMHLNLGLAYGEIGKGSLAIKHTKKAKELFKSQGNLEQASLAGHNLRWLYNKYEGQNKPQPVAEQPTRATGTGFLLGSSNYVVTNYHVVKGFNSLQVKFLNGEKVKAKLRANDKANDVAVLELVNPPDLVTNSMVLGDSSSVEMGDRVFTISYPVSGILGKNPKYAEGAISSTTGIADDPRMFQITVPIQPGNSGGPLLNKKGEVIGITTSSLDALKAFKIMGAIPQNVNFAVKSSFVKAVMQTIPDSLLTTKSIVVVPSNPDDRVSGLIKQVKNNIVLVEASTDDSMPAFAELEDAKSLPVSDTSGSTSMKEKIRLANPHIA
jgi:tetratricopeptide (TPR) repeat protein